MIHSTWVTFKKAEANPFLYKVYPILNKELLLRIIIKAHLDGVGRGEWGEAHILAHKAGSAGA